MPAKNLEALEEWKGKLVYFQVEEATTADPEQKFRLKRLIADAEANIERLEVDAQTTSGGVAPTRLHHTAQKLFGRNGELARFDAAWHNPEIHVVTLVAWGGVGKTSLVSKWAAGLAKRNFDGASYFDWSFYSQGTSDQVIATADPFVDAALRHFGAGKVAGSAASAWDKGAYLAQLLARHRALLVLDGLEPLQHPPGPLAGELKDPAITALLKGLAASNAGLCIVTTREPLKDLTAFEESTAPRWPLEHLATEAGVELLKALGVHGSAADLTQLVEQVKGHALTLNLLGRYLHDAHGGDIRKRDLITFEEADNEVQGGHAFRVIAAYEHWFATEGEKGQRLLAILRLLGPFDRPATPDCLKALRQPPPIPYLTEPLASLTEAQWNVTLARLRQAHLVTTDQGALDAHPLLREHFARQLQEHHPQAWREAHSRLFDHLTTATEEYPGTLAGLQPLYQAVAHGCLAGRYEEARAKVYRNRILRGTGQEGFYSTRELGAIGADLNAVACFFVRPWSRVAPALPEAAQAWLLNEAAVRLCALGRLLEAVEAIRAGLELRIHQKAWGSAAILASNLSTLEVSLGHVLEAVRAAEQGVDFADRSGDAFWRMTSRTVLADALHQAGNRNVALAHFREAEALQAEWQPSNPRLSSLPGFRYWDFLLASAERATAGGLGSWDACSEVEQQAESALPLGRRNNWLLDIGLAHLTLSRARLYVALGRGQTPRVAEIEIDQAVDGLRLAGHIEFVAQGLLTRAWLRCAMGDATGARSDLAEAEEIAKRGPMPLQLADVALYRARLFQDRNALREARRLVDLHQYGRREEEVTDLEAVMGKA